MDPSHHNDPQGGVRGIGRGRGHAPLALGSIANVRGAPPCLLVGGVCLSLIMSAGRGRGRRRIKQADKG